MVEISAKSSSSYAPLALISSGRSLFQFGSCDFQSFFRPFQIILDELNSTIQRRHLSLRLQEAKKFLFFTVHSRPPPSTPPPISPSQLSTALLLSLNPHPKVGFVG